MRPSHLTPDTNEGEQGMEIDGLPNQARDPPSFHFGDAFWFASWLNRRIGVVTWVCAGRSFQRHPAALSSLDSLHLHCFCQLNITDASLYISYHVTCTEQRVSCDIKESYLTKAGTMSETIIYVYHKPGGGWDKKSWLQFTGEVRSVSQAHPLSTLSRVTRVGFANCSASGNYEAFRMDEVHIFGRYSNEAMLGIYGRISKLISGSGFRLRGYISEFRLLKPCYSVSFNDIAQSDAKYHGSQASKMFSTIKYVRKRSSSPLVQIAFHR
jgi:hypothetical protein